MLSVACGKHVIPAARTDAAHDGAGLCLRQALRPGGRLAGTAQAQLRRPRLRVTPLQGRAGLRGVTSGLLCIWQEAGRLVCARAPACGSLCGSRAPCLRGLVPGCGVPCRRRALFWLPASLTRGRLFFCFLFISFFLFFSPLFLVEPVVLKEKQVMKCALVLNRRRTYVAVMPDALGQHFFQHRLTAVLPGSV